MTRGLLDPEIMRAFRFYGTVSLTMVISAMLGFGAGWWLDRALGTRPALASVGFVVGTIAGFWGVWKLAAGYFGEH